MSTCEPYDYMVDEPDDEPDLDELDEAYQRVVEERENAHEQGMDLT